MADQPAGPFQAQPEPLITLDLTRRLGLQMGQAIDPSIYIEEDGTPYLLFGNSFGAIVQLTDDMTGIVEDTMQNLDGLYDFRERLPCSSGTDFIILPGHATTGSEDYHVNYGTSNRLFGPVTYHYPVRENSAKGMLGTTHRF